MRRDLKVVLHVDTVSNRKKMQFKDAASYEAEINLSKQLLAQKLKFELDMILTISSPNKGKSVDFSMIDHEVQAKSALLGFGNFFAVNIPNALRFYLKNKFEELSEKKPKQLSELI